jgi:hypothetical protein
LCRYTVGAALRAIAKGTTPVPSKLADGAFWELAGAGAGGARLRARGGGGGGGGEYHWPGLELRAPSFRAKLRVDGYLQCPSPAALNHDNNDDGNNGDDGGNDGDNDGNGGGGSGGGGGGGGGGGVDPWTHALGGDTTLDDVADAMGALRDAGWPPVAIYAFDAAWVIIDKLFEVAAAVLDDDDILLEPSCFAWALQGLPSPASGGGGGGGRGDSSIGTNFPLPHRDYSAKEAWTNGVQVGVGGDPTLLSVWMPVTDATLDSGCLYVVPRGADKCWDDPTHPDHLRPAEAEPGGGAALHFPLACARPLPAAAGSVCMWAGNTIHWGAACRIREGGDGGGEGGEGGAGGVGGEGGAGGADGAFGEVRGSGAGTTEQQQQQGGGGGSGGRGSAGQGQQGQRRPRPRHSIAMTFRKRGAPAAGCSMFSDGLSREECAAMDVAARVRLVAQSLVLYSRWYELPTSLPGLLED